jgi:hypothetical protein
MTQVQKGSLVEVLSEGEWWDAEVTKLKSGQARVHYVGGAEDEDEWIPISRLHYLYVLLVLDADEAFCLLLAVAPSKLVLCRFGRMTRAGLLFSFMNFEFFSYLTYS